MGLSISRTIIQSHGGELNAARNELHGLTMTFSLPAHGPLP
jgi:signal transduction histidine kinase